MKTNHRLFLQLLPILGGAWLALIVPTTPLAAAPGDEHWDSQFGWPGVTNIVYAIAERDGRVYAGGTFGINTISNTTLHVWNGVEWSGLADFAGPGSVTIYDLAFLGNDLYAAGDFTQANGAPIRGLARWDGASWSSVGFDGAARALAVDGNNLYVGGFFTNAGGVAMDNIGRWDGTAWHALGPGLGGRGDGVLALAIGDGVLYAGGGFTNSGTLALSNIACWNGAAWTSLGSGVSSLVAGLALKGSDLYAGGLFTAAGGAPASRIARWDGATWSALGSGVTGGASGASVISLAFLGDLLCAAGNFTTAGSVSAGNFAVWNGSEWEATGGLGSPGTRVISAGTNVFVGGLFDLAGGIIGHGIARWDGTQWSGLGRAGRSSGVELNVRAFASDGHDIYAGGVFRAAGRITATRVGRYDGTNWWPLSSGVRGTNTATTAVNALAYANGNLYAGGIFTNAGGITASNIARWDGANWFPLGAGLPGTVAAIAVRGSDVFVGGTFTLNGANGGTAFNIARWDGNIWWRLPGASFLGLINNFSVNALAVQGSDLYVGGSFFAGNFSGQTTTNIARHDGSDWMPLGGGVNSNVNAIAIAGGQVYVGGRFSRAGGVSARRVAKWDGSNWSDLGGGVNGTGNFAVTALAAIGTNLYAGGSFTNAGGIDVNRVARWEGSHWSAMGRGLSRNLGTPSVSALAAFGPDVYVGGGFEFAGDKSSYYIARWNEQIDFDFVPSIQLGKFTKGAIGPFKMTVTASGVPSYVIEGTTNFSSWTPLLTNTASPYEFWDFTAPAHPHRFYRARQGP